MDQSVVTVVSNPAAAAAKAPPKPNKPNKPPKIKSLSEKSEKIIIPEETPNLDESSISSKKDTEWLDNTEKRLSRISDFVQTLSMDYAGDGIVKEGVLMKMNRKEMFEKYTFVLTKDDLKYKALALTGTSAGTPTTSAASVAITESTAAGSNGDKEFSRVIPLDTMLIKPLEDSDLPHSPGDRNRIFKLFSRQKSFFVKTSTVQEKDEWMRIITQTIRDKSIDVGGKILTQEETAPIWAVGDKNCRQCNVKFSFFVWKHHCRNCGKAVCEDCSREKVRILRMDHWNLFKVCQQCADHIKANRVYGSRQLNDDDGT